MTQLVTTPELEDLLQQVNDDLNCLTVEHDLLRRIILDLSDARAARGRISDTEVTSGAGQTAYALSHQLDSMTARSRKRLLEAVRRAGDTPTTFRVIVTAIEAEEIEQ